MTDEQDPVGSVSEEALKLFQALQDWARDTGADSATAGAASAFRTVNEHIATGGEECRYCPLCRVIAAAREVSPEVKGHLSSAATSLLSALAAMSTESSGDRRPPGGGVEKIDLSDGGDWDA